MFERKRVIAMLIAVLLLGTLLFSLLYVEQNRHHHCSGEDCPICLELHTVVNNLTTIRSIPLLPCVVAILSVFARLYVAPKPVFCVKKTLIEWKEELLD